MLDWDGRWASLHPCRGSNMWDAYHSHYLKWVRVSISDIIIQCGHSEEIDISQTGAKFKGNYTALHHLNNEYLMGIWDKYNVIRDDNQPIFEDWRRFYAGVRKKKTFIYLPIHSKKPVVDWDWTRLLTSYPSFKNFLNIFGQPGMGDYNFKFYFTTPDCIKLYQGEIAKAYFINMRLNIEQKWRCYNSNKWSLRRRNISAATKTIEAHPDETDSPRPSQQPRAQETGPSQPARSSNLILPRPPTPSRVTPPRRLPTYADAIPK